jgi:hypothetical protein
MTRFARRGGVAVLRLAVPLIILTVAAQPFGGQRDGDW